ncbi:hypothetical protein [Methyloglobulus sp.]|uniref:hypothetical protein n=1 Tax=Methyloglobulus sp. TaxID=2518622 RepID=UPI0032B6FB4F
MSQEIQIAIIAASSAIAGSVISQIITGLLSWIDKKHQKQVLLRQKYEEMALLYADSLEWFLNTASSTSYGQLSSLALPVKLKQVQILCSIYFPKLHDPAVQYANACNSYYQSILVNFNPALNIPASFQAETREEHKNVVKNITAARQSFDKAIIDFAKYYAKA